MPGKAQGTHVSFHFQGSMEQAYTQKNNMLYTGIHGIGRHKKNKAGMSCFGISCLLQVMSCVCKNAQINRTARNEVR